MNSYLDLKKLEIAKNRKGFIAALDQSGGSTPKALENYGIKPSEYNGEEEMFELVQNMFKTNKNRKTFKTYLQL